MDYKYQDLANCELNELRDEELDAVSGGFLALVMGAALGALVGASAVDGFVATMVNKVKTQGS
jgi:lactobin A/cerein 7B family class IIb bacteriocin